MNELPGVRVVLADDHPIVREGLTQLLNAQPDIRVVGQASDGEEAWRKTKELAPDVLVMDLSMPRLGGAEAAERVRRDCPDVKIIALTVHEERGYLTHLLRAGAMGYVLKRAAPEELVRAVRTVAAGGVYVDPSMAAVVVEGFLGARPGPAESPTDPLSPREREVLVRVARGYSNKEIAAELAIGVRTVETYKARLMEKLGLRTRVDLVRFVTEQGWLSSP